MTILCIHDWLYCSPGPVNGTWNRGCIKCGRREHATYDLSYGSTSWREGWDNEMITEDDQVGVRKFMDQYDKPESTIDMLRDMTPEELDKFADITLSHNITELTREDLHNQYPPIDWRRLFWAVLMCACVVLIALLVT